MSEEFVQNAAFVLATLFQLSAQYLNSKKLDNKLWTYMQYMLGFDCLLTTYWINERITKIVAFMLCLQDVCLLAE